MRPSSFFCLEITLSERDKPFKTIDEQIGILRSRGVIIGDEEGTRNLLLRNNYYSMINGYKEFFLDKDRCNKDVEVYRDGTRIEHIAALYRFDTMLRFSMTHCLLSAEKALKTVTVHAFCERHRGIDDYLDPASYCSKRDYSGKNYTKNLIRLLSTLQSLRDGRGRDRPYIEHYRTAYDGVPLWVLANALTFGNMSHFYDLQEISVQNEACRLLCMTIGANHLKARKLKRAYSILTDFRNICAHGGRLFCAKSGVRRDKRFIDMMKCLALVSTENESALALSSIAQAFVYLSPIDGLSEMVLEEMGFKGDDAMRAELKAEIDRQTEQFLRTGIV